MVGIKTSKESSRGDLKNVNKHESLLTEVQGPQQVSKVHFKKFDQIDVLQDCLSLAIDHCCDVDLLSICVKLNK